MIFSSRSVLRRITLCIMKHPCLFGFCFAIGTIIAWWNLSSFAHASRKFHIRDMRLFPFGSNVRDIYNGSLESLGRFLQQGELRFVAYYAPWCAQSRKMVPEMGLAADILKETYIFIAINCWVGSCRMNFTLQEFPKFFAYHSTYPPVEFIEPPESSRIVNFLQSIARPLTHVGNENTLQELISLNEAIIFGYFNISDEKNKRFSVFLNLCIKSVNRDSRVLCGIVTSSRIAELIGFRRYGQLILRQILGKQWFFPSTLNFTSDIIFSWISKHHTEFAMKLSPNILNLDHYITQLKRGPAVLLFVSQRPANNRRSIRVLHQFKHAAAVYNNCSEEMSSHDTSKLSDASDSVIKTSRKSEPCVSFNGQVEAKLCDLCKHTRVECFRETNRMDSYVRSSEILVRYINYNSCSCLQNYWYSNCEYMTVCCVKISKEIEDNASRALSTIFDNVKREDNPKRDSLVKGLKNLASFNNTNIAFKKTFDSMIDAFEVLVDVSSKADANLSLMIDRTRDFTTKALQQKVNRRTHKDLRLLRERYNVNQGSASFGGASRKLKRQQRANFSSIDFIGLRCKTNKTVNFFYLDLDIHRNMIRGLGINSDLFKTSLNHPIVAIVDVKNEATFVMRESPSLAHTAMANFITNFTNGKLERHLRTSGEEIENRRIFIIREVTTGTFEEIVLDSSKDVFLLYYAPWCGFCKPAQRVFLELARRFETISTLQFARINADVNELPYHYTVAGFPSFILFPKNRKSHSHAYPDTELINAQEMTNFLSKYSSRDTRTALTRLIKTWP